MLDMANLTDKDFLIDLGSGDGRTVITAAQRGARALGIEYNPKMVELSRRYAAMVGVTGKATFQRADIFKSDFSKATVLTLFLLPDINIRLRPKILNMKPGLRVVSNAFDMGDWEPDETATVSDDCSQFCTAFYWLVPAKVQGTWQMPRGGEFVFEQNYQKLAGTTKSATPPRRSATQDTGDQISFTAGDTTYTGRVNGYSITGTAKSPAGETKWQPGGSNRRTGGYRDSRQPEQSPRRPVRAPLTGLAASTGLAAARAECAMMRLHERAGTASEVLGGRKPPCCD